MSGTGIFEGKTEEQAREQILSQVREYCDEFHKKKRIRREIESLMQDEFMMQRKW